MHAVRNRPRSYQTTFITDNIHNRLIRNRPVRSRSIHK